MDNLMKQYNLTGWSFNQLNNNSQRFIKDDIVIVSIIHNITNDIKVVVDIYQDNKFLTSRDSLEEAFDFIEDL